MYCQSVRFPFNWDANHGILDSIRYALTHYPVIVHFLICLCSPLLLNRFLLCIKNWQAQQFGGCTLCNLCGIMPDISRSFNFPEIDWFIW